jgi:hypothetical protein
VVIHLKYQWANRRIDSEKAAVAIEDFLKQHHFSITASSDGCQTVWTALHVNSNHVVRRLVISIMQDSCGFTVELRAGSRLDPLLKNSFILQLLGAGGIMRSAYETQDYYRRMEDEFWEMLEKAIQ